MNIPGVDKVWEIPHKNLLHCVTIIKIDKTMPTHAKTIVITESKGQEQLRNIIGK